MPTPTPTPTHEIHGRTPTMLGVWCPATGPRDLTCIYGADHSIDYHQSPSGTKWRTHAGFVTELKARFGDDPMSWAFECPNCHDIATVADLAKALAAQTHPEGEQATVDVSDIAGQQCIGRLLPSATDRPRARGCDWAAFGLFRGPEFVVMPDGREVASFPIAPATAAEVTP